MLHAIISACCVDLQYGKRRDRNRRGKERKYAPSRTQVFPVLPLVGILCKVSCRFSLCTPGGGSGGAGSGQPAPCLGWRETWSSKANLCFLVFSNASSQKPCSCLSLWKSCGQREKVHTCVCLCVLPNSCVFKASPFTGETIFAGQRGRAHHQISGPVCLLCNCLVVQVSLCVRFSWLFSGSF